jgi:hypothetical protein
MPKDILSMYGPDVSKSQVASMKKNGPVAERDVMNYSTPVGPIGISRTGVGLGGTNLGCCGTQGQRPSTGDGAGGAVGIRRLGGEGLGMGTNRKG